MRGKLALSPSGLGVRIAHWLRIGLECGLAMAAATALLWGPPLPGAPEPAGAAYPPAPPSFDLEPARLAAAAEMTALAAALGPLQTERVEVEARVRRGDTLRSIFERAKVEPRDYNTAIVALRDVFDARDLKAGQRINLYLQQAAGEDARLLGLSFTPDVAQTVQVARLTDGAYKARRFDVPLTRRVARAHGEITESLYADAKRAGADDQIVADIANLLSFSVDFQREIYPGDDFDILFEQYLDPSGEVVKTGEIYYLSFAPNGKPLEYWRYTPPGEDEDSGFYDVKGESARRFLMRTPVNATRISSGFSAARRHPVLGYTRAHKGTDFAAPRGTPIYAAGSGVVERANRYGSFGNYVRIRHANGYKTIYGHLNGFARGIRAGVRVTQGQTIGYVGMTGTATGPHLHYEVHVNGTAVNPMRIDAPTGRTLTDEEKLAFDVERAIIDSLRERAAPASSHPSDVLIASERTEADPEASIDPASIDALTDISIDGEDADHAGLEDPAATDG